MRNANGRRHKVEPFFINYACINADIPICLLRKRPSWGEDSLAQDDGPRHTFSLQHYIKWPKLYNDAEIECLSFHTDFTK